MKPDRIAQRLFIFGVGILFVAVSASCNMPSLDITDDLATLESTSTSTPESEQATDVPTEMPSETPKLEDTPTPSVPLGPTMTPLAPPFAPQVPLSEQAPWLIYRAGEDHSQSSTLFIVNADGSGRRPLSSGISQDFDVEVKPSGDRFAYIVPGSDAADRVPHLVVRRIPDGEIETDIALISEDVWEILSSKEDLYDQILTALSGPEAFEWSPHVGGHYLAFAAALDNPKLDLYRFDTWSNNIRPLSTGQNHRFQPFWSPDGQWVLHLEVEDFGQGGLWNVEAMSAVSFDGSDAKELYDTKGNRHTLVKWISDTSFLVIENSSSGPRNLMRVKISSSSPDVLYLGSIAELSETSFDDLQTVVAFCLEEAQGAPGIHFYYFEDGETELVLPGSCRSVAWWPGKGVFVANGEEGTALIRRTGEVVKQMEEIRDPVSLSSDGQWMVSYGEGGATVFTHIGTLIREATDGAVWQVIWQPEADGFFLDLYDKGNSSGAHHLYTYNLSEWELQLVDLDFRGDHFWGGSEVPSP